MNPHRAWPPLATFTLLLMLQPAAMAEKPAARVAASAASAPASETDNRNCDRLWRAYDRSAACYARFRTVHGVKAEAADHCGAPVKEPVDCPRRR